MGLVIYINMELLN